jgi:hypothetical protein
MGDPGNDERAARAWVSRTKWLGGSPCSGKSTVRALLARYGIATYSCDDRFDRHAAVAVMDGQPTFTKVVSLPACRRLAQPVDDQVRDVLALSDEQWPYIVKDLASRRTSPVVVEGSALRPSRLLTLGVPPSGHLVGTHTELSTSAVRDPGLGSTARVELRRPRRGIRAMDEPRRGIRRPHQERNAESRYRVFEVDGSQSPETIADFVRRHLAL